MSFSLISIFCLLFLATGKAPNVDQFAKEAENAVGRQVDFAPMPSNRVELGYTDFDHTGSVLIEVRDGLPPEVVENVKAHELGHVILLKRRLHADAYLSQTGMKRDRTFMVTTVETLVSCYEDPLADAEAKKRGFHPELMNDYVAQKTARVTMFDIEKKRRIDDLMWNYQAMFLYCFELRPHTFKNTELEQRFAISRRSEPISAV